MFRRFLLAVAAAWILPAGNARPADSVTVAIHTTILPVCRFSAAVPVEVHAADGTSSVTVTASAPPSSAMIYRCTNGTAPAFTVTGAATGCAACPEIPDMAFMLSPEGGGAGRGFGDGRDLTLIVTGPISPTRFQVASMRVFASAVSITVSP